MICVVFLDTPCCYWVFLTFKVDGLQWFRVYGQSCFIHIKMW